jgi:hypothetical protein
MKILRIVLGILAIIPLALLIEKMLLYPTEYDEYSLQTLIYVAVGIPILFLNLLVWISPKPPNEPR